MDSFFNKVQQLINKPRSHEHNATPSNSAVVKPISLETAIELNRIEEDMRDRRKIAHEIAQLSIFVPADSAFERFRNLFKRNEFDFRSWEMDTACLFAFLGFVTGLFLKDKWSNSATFVRRFQTQHNLSLFESKSDYVRRLCTFVGANALKENIPRGLKLGSICFMSSFATVSLAAIRNEMYYRDIIIGYSVTGFLYRIQRGLKAAFASAFLSAIYGIFFVVVCWPVFVYNGQTPDTFYKKAQQEHYHKKLLDTKEEREITFAMEMQNLSYRQAKERVTCVMKEEKERLVALHNLKIDSIVNKNN